MLRWAANIGAVAAIAVVLLVPKSVGWILGALLFVGFVVVLDVLARRED